MRQQRRLPGRRDQIRQLSGTLNDPAKIDWAGFCVRRLRGHAGMVQSSGGSGPPIGDARYDFFAKYFEA